MRRQLLKIFVMLMVISLLAPITLEIQPKAETISEDNLEKEENEAEEDSADDEIEQIEERITVVIKNENDYCEFIDNCQVNQWSLNKLVLLQNDLDLEGMEVGSIPVFSGIFDGQNHTISGIEIQGNGYADGVFRYIERTAIVKNLNVKGIVESKNDEECTGGLCGINSGWIQNCGFSGTVSGKKETGGLVGENEYSGIVSNSFCNGVVTGYDRAGGIAGSNYGTIRNCINKACVNADSSWLEEEDEEGYEKYLRDIEEKKLISGTDIGGIAGYSVGSLMNCTNYATVGYEHNGYNIGGIVGRQAGQVIYCVNSGRVFGRKDIGGIAGQMEPSISVEEAESLSEAINRLHDQVDKFLTDSGKTTDVFGDDFEAVRGASKSAVNDAQVITKEFNSFVNQNIESVNELASRLDYLSDQMPDILQDTRNSVNTMSECASDLRRVAEALDYKNNIKDTTYNEALYARLSLVTGVGGKLLTSSINPDKGDLVTITVVTDDNYILKNISARDVNGMDVSISGGQDKYQFTMPRENVVVEATFKYSRSTDANKTSEYELLPDSSLDDYLDDEADLLDETLEDASAFDDFEQEEIMDLASGSTADYNDVIVESNAGGDAYASIQERNITLYITPNTGYRVADIDINDSSLNSISYIKRDSTDTYDISVPSGAKYPVKIMIRFGKKTDEQAFSDSQNSFHLGADELANEINEINNLTIKIDNLIAGRKLEDLSKDELEQLNGYLKELGKHMNESGRIMSYLIGDLNSYAGISSYYIQESIKNAKVEITKLTNDLEKALNYMNSGFDRLRAALIYINGKDDVRFVSMSDSMNSSLDNLFDHLDEVSNYAGCMNRNLGAGADTAEADLHIINDQINIIAQLFTQKVENLEDIYFDEDIYEDVSEEEIEMSVDGRVDMCTNDGEIRGDVNVGGITGAMAIDKEDPEGNAAGTSNKSLGNRYITKCITSECINRGNVYSKKDGSGGVAGYMNLGIIKGCENYGNIESLEGEYAGGIAGQSTAVIRNCYSMGNINAGQYVGGIAGVGRSVSECFSLVTIPYECSRAGAIVGFVDKKENERADVNKDLKDNYYVSRSLGGIDNVSYIKAAMPLNYEELIQLSEVPEDFRHLKLRLMVGEELIDVIDVSYGQKLDELDIPQAPSSEAEYNEWPDLSNRVVEGNVLLVANTSDKITTLSADNYITVTNEDGTFSEKCCVYADGSFGGNSKIRAEYTMNGENQITYQIMLENTDLNENSITKVRVYNPYDGKYSVKMQQNGKMTSIDAKEYGKYLQVDFAGIDGSIIIEKSNNMLLCIYIVAGVLVFIVLFAVVIVILKKNKKAKN